MRVKITETGEFCELSIIDPKSETDWINDLMGNYGELPEYDDEEDAYLMTKEDYAWWESLVNRYQNADNRYHALLSEVDDPASFEAEISDACNCDLDDMPEAIQAICDKWENEA